MDTQHWRRRRASCPGRRDTYFNAISPGYFAAVGTRLLAGREFGETDTDGAPRVVIVNATLAARTFPGVNPLGRHLTVGRHADRQNLIIVGVVADATYQRLQETRRAIAYLPHRQSIDARTGQPIFFGLLTAQPACTSSSAPRSSRLRTIAVRTGPPNQPPS